MRSLMLIFSAVSILLLAPVYANSSALSNYCPPPQTLIKNISALPGDAIGISLIAIILSIDVLGVGYLASKLLPTAGVRGWLNAEVWEVAKSAMLIAAIYSILTFASSIVYIVQGTPQQFSGGSAGYLSNIGGILYGSETYLCGVENSIESSSTAINNFLVAEGALKSITITDTGVPIPPVDEVPYIPVFASGVSFPALDNFFIATDIIYHGQFMSFLNDVLVVLILPMVMIFTSQVILLPILVSLGLVVLIPSGLIMRALPFARGVGGTLIAFGIGISIIWPSLLVILNAPASNYMYGILTIGQQVQPNYVGTDIISRIACGPLGFLGGQEMGLSCSTFFGIYPVLNFSLGYTLYLAFQLFFLFVLDLIIVFPVTDAIAKMLGGTIRFSLGGKLKLV